MQNTRHLDTVVKLVRTFTLHAHACDVQLGDRVLPETPMGLDFVTGQPVTANCYGAVDSIRFGGEDYPLVVVVTPE
jgi:hypothetical protein